jgi:formate dehydrogenase major subunit
MTNHWADIQGARLVLVGGGNPAENHPLGFRHVEKALEGKDCELVVVDPRFTRTAALAGRHLAIRPGTDLAYLAAIIRHVLEGGHYDAAYVRDHTNARLLVHEEFRFENGVFSGFVPADAPGGAGRYETETWGYRLGDDGRPLPADDLEAPGTVFSHLKAHFAPYTFEMAERVTGIPAGEIERLAEAFVTRRPATILYALGMTQHTTGAQAIRCYGILQLLLGNVGVPGGGVNACRGEANVQGSSDLGALAYLLPGYLPPPGPAHETLDDYEKAHGRLARRRVAALCTAWWGRPDGYRFLPRVDRSAAEYSWTDTFERMAAGEFDLWLLLAENPAVSAANAAKVHAGLTKLKTLVAIDLYETETAAFFKAPGTRPEDVGTEVFLLPAAYGAEKAGSVTNSCRWIQWGEKAIEPPGEARSDAEIVDALHRAVRDVYAGSTAEGDRAIHDATWGYGSARHPILDEEKVLEEIGGRDLHGGRPLESTREVTDLPEGTVACGQWLYAGVFARGENRSKRRDPERWSYAWPDDIRILYNRASADAGGHPRDPARAYVWWDAESGRWTGHDVPDVPDPNGGPATPEGRAPFRRLAEGVARLFVGPYRSPDGTLVDRILADGPLPVFYEPVESPSENLLHPGRRISPLVRLVRGTAGRAVVGEAAEYPHVLTTHDVVEHWLSGTVTSRVPALREAMPGPFVEIGRALGDRLGVRGGEVVVVETARGSARLPAVVTGRLPEVPVDGRPVSVVSIHWAWGWSRPAPQDIANLVTSDVVEPNTGAPEYKSALCRVRRG